MSAKMFLQVPNTRFFVMKDRGGQRGVGTAFGEHFDEMIEVSGAS